MTTETEALHVHEMEGSGGLLLKISTNILLFALVFGMSATVEIHSFACQLKNRAGIFTGVFLQFFLLPFVGFCVVQALKLDAVFGVTLLVVTSSPGGSFSNWFCSTFNADLALSVTMTAISNFLAVAFLPLNLYFYSKAAYNDSEKSPKVDLGSMAISLSITISAIVLGLLCSAKVHSFPFNRIMNKMGTIAGVTLLLVTVFASSFGGDDEPTESEDNDGANGLLNQDWKFYIGVAMPVFLGLIFSNFISLLMKLLDPERVTVSIECCYQNTGIATTVAIGMFDEKNKPKALLVPLYYSIINAIILSIYCISAWKVGWTKAPPNEKFCTIISESYEVILSEEVEMEAIEVILGIRTQRSPNNADATANETHVGEKRGGELIVYYPDISPPKRLRRLDSMTDVEHGLEIIPYSNNTIMEAWYGGSKELSRGLHARVREGHTHRRVPSTPEDKPGPDVFFNASTYVSIELSEQHRKDKSVPKILYSRVLGDVDEHEAYVDLDENDENGGADLPSDATERCPPDTHDAKSENDQSHDSTRSEASKSLPQHEIMYISSASASASASDGEKTFFTANLEECPSDIAHTSGTEFGSSESEESGKEVLYNIRHTSNESREKPEPEGEHGVIKSNLSNSDDNDDSNSQECKKKG
uniref:Uncharacterized protein n=1 Tax=Corethron hystrix TaxID=216773 RepID=A0A7S1C179_9STRA|mmetsp:Transcript_8231/g.17869  ORF Transcript_8231/g.17869 Transcript_8231/m.17869 type:complete len:646 (+) Transcript_8231:354-2291(+)|eukprot:CAMPEP_0113311162 /NCGR_PEP_ID=MMETSP0010_2-20120614/8508_1 /TAXON_ID=216773 ORGANISM="Corethron hystrix, Strain 308" /NCGR_SAMPLE_ID=MMETSP0010_2 /ASSEMBLY_ACC=CAM_ASM_000155 /LENGTH=645 /DNA_ID=CAMNT_0000166743 /DNA_START=261 /DNA_END=2198 /DNA_ORIENTATION=+ /assembly_acc=CAM_ASM_000155